MLFNCLCLTSLVIVGLVFYLGNKSMLALEDANRHI